MKATSSERKLKIKKAQSILGLGLAISGAFLATFQITGGLPLLPHILGPIVLVGLGALFLVLGRGALNRRILLIVVVLAIFAVLGALLWAYGPSLMETVIDMHRAG